jgi:cation diffusion facilitator CzcD-associated flavoprotein CzcO
MEDLWKEFSFSELFASRDEIIAYFHYVDEKLNLRRDMAFHTCVVSAAFNADTDRWAVTTDTGITVQPRFLLLCIGWASTPVVPDYTGLKTFRVACHHPARWPQGGIEFKNKRVGIIGTGPTGVQVAQEAAKQAADLTVFLRTPPAAVPMRQRRIDKKMQQRWKKDLIPHMLRRRMQMHAGGIPRGINKSILEVSPEERILTLDELWEKGSFHFFGVRDVHTNKQANNLSYAFWLDKVSERIDDLMLQEILAPSGF